jgi:hypothetical protein
LKTAVRHKIQRKAGDGFDFGSRMKFSSRTELKEKLGHTRSMVRDPPRLGLNFKFGSRVHELRFLKVVGCFWKFWFGQDEFFSRTRRRAAYHFINRREK